MAKKWLRPALGVLVVLGAVGIVAAVVMRAHRATPPPPGLESSEVSPPLGSDSPIASGAAPALPADVALLDGLKVGDELGGWKVAAITRSSVMDMNGALAVWLEKAPATFIIWITDKGAKRKLPPLETERHAIYYGALLNAAGTNIQGAVDAVAARVRTSEAKAK
jgi:hypothetical protein